MQFEDFYWHDAIIKNIIIDRNCPGVKDEIKIKIKWPEDNGYVNFIFEEVYWSRFELNFGIFVEENILQAHVLQDADEDLIHFYLLWKNSMNGIELNAYEILLNSTGGRIKIIAKGFRIEKL